MSSEGSPGDRGRRARPAGWGGRLARFRRSPLGRAALAVAVVGSVAVASPAAAASDTGYDGPVVIRRGGVYTGHWESTDPDVPAVTVATDEPVVIVDSRVRGRGDLILGTSTVDLTVRNTWGFGLDPGEHGRAPGQFVATDGGFTNLVVENNSLHDSGGIWAFSYEGDRTPSQTLRVVRNRAVDLDGRWSDGDGGWLTGEDDHTPTQFLQLDDVAAVPHVEVAWNEIVNRPGQSRVEDSINLFRSGGTPESPIRIHHNLVDGAYPALPRTQGFSGGGIIVGDLPPGQPALGHVEIHDNVVLATTNYGISIVCGHDQRAWGNRIVASGVLPDGERIGAQNVGLSIGSAAQWGSPCPAYVRNAGFDNVVGFQRTETSRNDWWTPSCDPADACSGNESLPGPITPATEDAERARWHALVAELGLVIGARDEPVLPRAEP